MSSFFLAKRPLAFLRNARGNVTVVFSVALVFLAAASGVAVDFLTTSANKTAVQGVLDSAALAGLKAQGSSATRLAVAERYFNANAEQLGFPVTRAVFKLSGDGSTITGNTTFKSSEAFMAMFAVKAKDIGVTTTAIAESKSQAVCIHALNSSASAALTFNNKRGPLTYAGPGMSAPDCTVRVNSNSSKAVLIKEASGYSFEQHCLVGGIDGTASTLSPAPDPTCKSSLADPLASMTLPAAASCASKTFASTSTTVTLTPGTYCGGLSVSKANIVLSPGVYVITGGSLKLAANTNLTGDGVTFVMRPGAGAIDIQSGGELNLKAPASGDTRGFIIIDRTGTATDHLIKTGVRDASFMTLDGYIYAPEDHVEIWFQRAGVAPNERPMRWKGFGVIGDTIDLHGYNQLFIEPGDLAVIRPDLVATSGTGAGGGASGTIRLVR